MTQGMQVAAVRLRLEEVPHRMATAAEFGEQWPFKDTDCCLLFCRRSATQDGFTLTASWDPGYVAADGAERQLANVARMRPLVNAARALADWPDWLASGSNVGPQAPPNRKVP